MSARNEIKKSDLRTVYKHSGLAYLSENGGAASVRLIENLKSVLPQDARVGAFRAKSDEINIDALFEDKVRFWAFPRVQDKELVFYHPHDGDGFAPGRFGIVEPNPLRSDRVDISSLEFVLVPGVAFDRTMHRLGRGQGYYDRALKNFNGIKIGVASAGQIAPEELPCDSHDVDMSLVATDKFILLRSQANG